MTAFSAEDYVYLDWAATAPLCEEAARAMAPFLVPGRVNVALGANANSLHSPGRAAFAALEDARRSLARDLHAARASEIVLTSGATEADNAAVLGLARAAVDARRQAGRAAAVPHVVTTAVEHEAVLEPVRVLERAGYRVTRLAPDARGFVQAGALADAVDGDTVLVSVQMANSEVGSIQPVADLAQIAHEAGALFHTDATQALGKMPVDLAALGVDAASFSAHKVGGPKGVGALYLRARTPFSAQLLGGGQEQNYRSGTEALPAIAAFGAACAAAYPTRMADLRHQAALRDTLRQNIAQLPGWQLLGAAEAPQIISCALPGVPSQNIINLLQDHDCYVSAGSACSKGHRSHVLQACGLPPAVIDSSIRISLSRFTTEAEAAQLLAAMQAATAYFKAHEKRR